MTDELQKTSEPAAEWEYRNMKCRVYRLGDIKTLGYVRIGDEWTQVLETDDTSENVLDRVEDEVDDIIEAAIEEVLDEADNTWPFDDPINPNPGVDPIDPNPNPIDPNPGPDDPFDPGPTWHSPIWMVGDEVPVRQYGTATVMTTDGTTTTVSLSDIDAEDIDDEGRYTG